MSAPGLRPSAPRTVAGPSSPQRLAQPGARDAPRNKQLRNTAENQAEGVGAVADHQREQVGEDDLGGEDQIARNATPGPSRAGPARTSARLVAASGSRASSARHRSSPRRRALARARPRRGERYHADGGAESPRRRTRSWSGPARASTAVRRQERAHRAAAGVGGVEGAESAFAQRRPRSRLAAVPSPRARDRNGQRRAHGRGRHHDDQHREKPAQDASRTRELGAAWARPDVERCQRVERERSHERPTRRRRARGRRRRGEAGGCARSSLPPKCAPMARPAMNAASTALTAWAVEPTT